MSLVFDVTKSMDFENSISNPLFELKFCVGYPVKNDCVVCDFETSFMVLLECPFDDFASVCVCLIVLKTSLLKVEERVWILQKQVVKSTGHFFVGCECRWLHMQDLDLHHQSQGL